MYDAVRWIILGVLFAGLLGTWLWSRRQAAGRQTLSGALGASFKVLQKRWVDQKTGICLVESEKETFLLAYTVGGGVSWQPLAKSQAPVIVEGAKSTPEKAKPMLRREIEELLPETLRR
jgi:hypothetical protein